jgi:hypothetical protein
VSPGGESQVSGPSRHPAGAAGDGAGGRRRGPERPADGSQRQRSGHEETEAAPQGGAEGCARGYVDLSHKDRDTVERFEAEVAALDEVIEVRRMFGLPDYVVRVGTPDLDTFEAFVTAGLGAVPGIAKVDSHLTMKVVKSPERPAASAARRSVRRRAR